MIVIDILLWGMLVVAGVLLTVLATPLWIELSIAREAAWQGSVAVRPLGRFGPRIVLPTSSGADRQAREVKTRNKHRSRRIPAGGVRLARDILDRIKIERLDLDMRFGLEDPAETGHLFGLLAPAVYGVSGAERVSLHVEPVFDRAVLAGRSEAVVSVVPMRLVAPVVRFGWRLWVSGR